MGACGALLAVALIALGILSVSARAQVVVPHPAQVIVPEAETPEPVEREPPSGTQVSSGPPAQSGEPPAGWGWQPSTPPPSVPSPPPAPPENPPTDSPNGPYDVDCGSVCLQQWVDYYKGWLSAIDDVNSTIDRKELHSRLTSLLSDLERDIDDAVQREMNADEYRRKREEREPKLPAYAEPDAISGGDLEAEPEPAPEYTEVTDEVVGPCPSSNPLRIADWIAGDGGSTGCF